jgi:hypothetical protein
MRAMVESIELLVQRENDLTQSFSLRSYPILDGSMPFLL